MPFDAELHSRSISEPTQSFMNETLRDRRSSRAGRTGCIENLSWRLPLGLPKCDISTTDLAPFSRQKLIEGRVETIRLVSVISLTPAALGLSGTLKSQRMRMR